jgi:2-isopropylmalate synthase
VFRLFSGEYTDVSTPYSMSNYSFRHASAGGGKNTRVVFKGNIRSGRKEYKVTGSGNGPIDAFFRALGPLGIEGLTFVGYSEQAVSSGSDSTAVAYVELRDSDNKPIFGVGTDSDISIASAKAVLSAINRSYGHKTGE